MFDRPHKTTEGPHNGPTFGHENVLLEFPATTLDDRPMDILDEVRWDLRELVWPVLDSREEVTKDLGGAVVVGISLSKGTISGFRGFDTVQLIFSAEPPPF